MRSYLQQWSLALAVTQACFAQYLESISGLGLVGSHFGIPFFNATFDYVIVGGGTAGLTIATRLAQNSTFSVAVIEAGGFSATDNGNLSAIPVFNAYWVGKSPFGRNPLIDWEIKTEPMPGFGGINMLYSAGKMLGGSSSRNSMTYHRSTKGAFQKWASMVGDDDWTWNKLLPFFERSVAFLPPNNDLRLANATPKYDVAGFPPDSGPLQISYPNHANAYSSWGAKALNEMGLKETNGNVGGNLIGYSYTTNTLDRTTQTRSSSETSFLRLALETTTNLSVYTRTLAKRILFDEKKKATGVVVDTGGVQYKLSAAKEVIVSAGVFRSPQLLMASGIGPSETLGSFDIPVVADRPGVGQNMQDHVLWAASYEVNLETHSRMQDPHFAALQTQAYLNNRTGVLTNTATELLGWEKLPAKYRANLNNRTREGLQDFPHDWPDFEVIIADSYGGDFNDFLVGAPLDGKNYASIGMGLQSVFSRGNVTIASSDTAINPVINPNLLGDQRDVDIAVQSFRRIREIASSSTMQKIIIGPEAFPGANITSDQDIRALLKRASNTIYHASCTCAMGRNTDKLAVVDSKGNVIGVQGLRVADASVFPFLPPGHPQSIVCKSPSLPAALMTVETNFYQMLWQKKLQILCCTRDSGASSLALQPLEIMQWFHVRTCVRTPFF